MGTEWAFLGPALRLLGGRGTFLFIYVWAISMTSCFVHRCRFASFTRCSVRRWNGEIEFISRTGD